METSSLNGRASYRGWVLGALMLLFGVGCASSPSTSPSPSGGDPVDVGYGTIERDQQTGSVSTIDGEDTEADRPRTLVEMLSRIPGVRVTQMAYGSITVRIRGGNTSFMANQDPLFVVDGVIAPSGDAVLGSISANQIESISVLKDAGDTAVFGSRGANGVILITLKTGGQ